MNSAAAKDDRGRGGGGAHWNSKNVQHYSSQIIVIGAPTLECFYRPDALLNTHPTTSQHWRTVWKIQYHNCVKQSITSCMSALALCCSVAEYCCPVWFRSAHTDLVDAQLNSSMRLISGTLRPTQLPWLPSSPTSHHPTYGERLLVTNSYRPWKCILIGQCTRTFSIIHHLA